MPYASKVRHFPRLPSVRVRPSRVRFISPRRAWHFQIASRSSTTSRNTERTGILIHASSPRSTHGSQPIQSRSNFYLKIFPEQFTFSKIHFYDCSQNFCLASARIKPARPQPRRQRRASCPEIGVHRFQKVCLMLPASLIANERSRITTLDRVGETASRRGGRQPAGSGIRH